MISAGGATGATTGAYAFWASAPAGLVVSADDAGVKAALGARSHLSLQALHRVLPWTFAPPA